MNEVEKVLRFIDLSVFVLIMWGMASAIPPNFIWFKPISVLIADSDVGSPPQISVGRIIYHPVLMSYQVAIRDVGNSNTVCDTSGGPFTYEPSALIPDDADLEWWVGGEGLCWPLNPGTYIVETCWTVEKPFWGLVPPKTICLNSNTFTIHP